ncbi:MAG: HAMP domain-containing sensor histidine kinase [Bacillota bacterium]|nr:HAMP domain-containing sensor histidine kinase [Bacillota bacterium]
MAANKKQRFSNILKTSSKFIVAFILLTILYALANMGVLVYLSGSLPIYEYAPVRQCQEAAALNWEEIHRLGGYGFLIDARGTVLWQSRDAGIPQNVSLSDLLNRNLTRGNERSSFTYTTAEGNWLILSYPSEVFSNEPTFSIDAAPAGQQRLLLFSLLALIALYLLGIFLLFHRLSVRLERSVQEIYEAEEEKKRFFFRGLAHDVKTPLATIMAYSRALGDGLLQAEQAEQYQETIFRQANVLKGRLDDMMEYASLEEQLADKMQKADVLEAIRRYVGENYSWFSEREAGIDIRFRDDDMYVTSFNQSLLARLLQNLLNNSVEHNAPGVCIHIGWDAKTKCLTLGDDGPGIPAAIHDSLFEPMVTGEPSRTGEQFRGMGLANVKRIAELHGWELDYDGEFRIRLA